MDSPSRAGPATFGAISEKLLRIAPFFLPFLMILAPLFMVISPIPLFILTLRNRPAFSFAAWLTNLALLSTLGDVQILTLGGVFWFGVGILFPLLIRKTGKVPLSATLCFFFFVQVILCVLLALAHTQGFGPIEYVRMQVSSILDQLMSNPNGPMKELIADQGREGLYRKVMTELPSGILIVIVLSLWVNLLFASQLMKNFLSKTFWSRYRNPEWLVWPTLACGGLFALTEHAPYLVGINGFKLFLLLYGLQGLSILSHFFNRLGVQGFLRTTLFGVALFLAGPLVVSLGFFDLWFDFRKKFGQF